ncbi:response regulator [Balneatrix alpica]|uniref:Response regulator n=1 Tax=Balneatrix alpica TaxID=75684 RepID=A0ABV5ZC21_9GAMM|nr:response regulator transcription factor [Balneatrix alpica]
MYRIITADDHPIFREAIVQVIRSRWPEAEVAETASVAATQALLEVDADYDLLLLDLNMEGMDGFQGLMRLREQWPLLPVVMMTAEEERQLALQALSLGAVGYIPKSSPRGQIQEALAQVLEGQVYLPASLMRAEAPPASPAAQVCLDPKLLQSLTRKQLQVLQLMAEGYANKQIAYELEIAEATVKAHVSAILHKLNLTNRVQAALAARAFNFAELKRW